MGIIYLRFCRSLIFPPHMSLPKDLMVHLGLLSTDPKAIRREGFEAVLI